MPKTETFVIDPAALLFLEKRETIETRTQHDWQKKFALQ